MHSTTKSMKGENGIKEKTGYEKFEAELKETVFGVIFLLVKEEDESLWYSVLDGIIELFQLLSFPFQSVTPPHQPVS
ncbi:MAG: hypothetical protein P4M11_10170 [Candidatus Pacebacteria bacterium]|nr:hypothetical protein [Candidatus Paceibacterota bacterium]